MKIDINSLAPIVVVAFNRPDALKSSLASLARNPLAENSDVFVFVDGPRENRPGEKEKVKNVISVAEAASGFKSVTVKASEQNKGLSKSVIGAATQLINQYGKVIVVEDDLYLSPSFLTYMNMMLQTFEHDDRIMQVTGYCSKFRMPKDYIWDVFLNRRANSWSWGTWKDRWETVDWEVKDYDDLVVDRKKRRAFNAYGSGLFGMLKGWKTGKNDSWYIRFNYSMFKQGRFAVYPKQSLVRNDGFTSDATNCKGYNRFKINFLEEYKSEWSIPQDLRWNKRINKRAVRRSTIPYRIYGKIMTAFYKVFKNGK